MMLRGSTARNALASGHNPRFAFDPASTKPFARFRRTRAVLAAAREPTPEEIAAAEERLDAAVSDNDEGAVQRALRDLEKLLGPKAGSRPYDGAAAAAA
eukprot:CAMPEP_0172163126 /NCGR_PEP_ID=MMETSP1050-20130122/7096_1 /TAXON_ID=233186 /ORGANISM="Cryptomonas curvata, Strain CCAP979/52" /LENGTH=98 /DNA_ID=CAMNT_0012833277 /DNA_START=294 /DNA_END=587 /DNA_ORIENTATION=+